MIQTITPIDNTIYIEREYNSKIIEETMSNSLDAQKAWASLKVKDRVELLRKFVIDFLSKEKQIVELIDQNKQIQNQIQNSKNNFEEVIENTTSQIEQFLEKVKKIN